MAYNILQKSVEFWGIEEPAMRNTPRRRKRATWKTILFLMVCFPYGLFLMWRTQRWHPAVKGLVTACFAALTVAVLLPMTTPPTRGGGGVRMVGVEKDVSVYGPELPASLDAEYAAGYGVVSGASAPVFSDAEEAEVTYVYANDSGEFYHLNGCKYVAYYSRRYALPVAYYNGYLPCQECCAPTYMPGDAQ